MGESVITVMNVSKITYSHYIGYHITEGKYHEKVQ